METKQAPISGENPVTGESQNSKRSKTVKNEGEEDAEFLNSDENLLFEVLKHVDAPTLAAAACVSRQWRETAYDERLWEVVCTRHWENTGCDGAQLRSVVLALGGFRRLHALCLWPLLKHSSSSSKRFLASSLGKDEVQFSLSVLSVRYYEKMSAHSRLKQR